jgi:cysteine sulfinate desulfinase/cysteine desulfurase-like protein
MIYLDHNATTPILPEVLDAMMPYLTTEWGNPSSTYRFGSKILKAIEQAREQVADLIGADKNGFVYMCGTEQRPDESGSEHLLSSATVTKRECFPTRLILSPRCPRRFETSSRHSEIECP